MSSKRQSNDETEEIDWSCLRCGGQLQDNGQARLREGGSGPVGHLFFGNLAELGERFLTVRVLGCTRCGEMAFVDSDVYPG
jgi:hypothetical protein